MTGMLVTFFSVLFRFQEPPLTLHLLVVKWKDLFLQVGSCSLEHLVALLGWSVHHYPIGWAWMLKCL
jgi:hypothetical protein